MYEFIKVKLKLFTVKPSTLAQPFQLKISSLMIDMVHLFCLPSLLFELTETMGALMKLIR